MYQLFQQISAVVSYPGLAIATGACLECQLSDICYFVLNVSKRFGACNSLVAGCVGMVCGTRVVHFPEFVVHAFSCTTSREILMYHS